MSSALDTPFDVIRAAAVRAGGLLRARFSSGNARIYEKSPFDIVTEADLEAEARIKETLQKADSSCGFYTEEHGKTHEDDVRHRWLIDPLDGTRNFSRGIPLYAVLIALQQREANGTFSTTAGAIYTPEHDAFYYAEKGKGARCYYGNNGNRRLHVAARDARPDKMIFLGAREASLPGAGNVTSVPSFRFRDIGCTGAALAAVADGKAEGILALNSNPWDMCAGGLLIREAGGQAAALCGRLDPVKGDHVAAGEPHTHALILQHCQSPIK